VECLPFHDPESGCTITADARLDNRDELIAAMGFRSDGRTAGDGELILRAYLQWGEKCPERLLGDFAFAIWDSRQHRLFCARDQMGMRQLTYAHLPGRTFVFATEPTAVIRHNLVPKTINEGRIGDFLDNMERATLTETFYLAVARLPPAHRLSVDRSGLRIERYWRLAMPQPLRLKRDEEYVAAFLDIFRGAISSRLRSEGRVGSMLSGGMDSGSISAIASEILSQQARGPLRTFSVAATDSSGSPETQAIEQSARMSGLAPSILRIGEAAEYRHELLQATREEAEPFDGQMSLLRMVYRAARSEGINVVLDGVGGDIVLSGTTYVAKLARAGSLRTAWAEAEGTARFWNVSPPAWSIFARNLWSAWAPAWAIRARRGANWAYSDLAIGRRRLISKQFADRIDLRKRRRATRLAAAKIGPLDADQRAKSIGHAILTVGRERYDRVAAEFAIEPRDPFMDIRLIDFCLSLPWQQLQADGWPKILLRRAMAGRLPDSVRWRPGIDHLGYDVMKLVLGGLDAAALDMDQVHNALAPYIRKEKQPVLPMDVNYRERCIESAEALCLYYWLQLASRSL
jgi:asparagine synthase (glutamine-hydrolysing)